MKEKIHEYLAGRLSEEEQEKLLEWIREEKHKRIFELEKAAWWKEIKLSQDGQTSDVGQIRLYERLREKQQLKRSSRLINFYRYAAIAMLVIGLSGGLFSYNNYFNTELQFTQVHTEPGQMSTMTLPDGSKIWINSDTELSYNSQYGLKNRAIRVSGEAYFEVAKDQKNPFIVDLGAIKVKVTGTHFSVSNYDELKNVNVILEEGSVVIQSTEDKLITQLRPDELAVFNKQTNSIQTMSVKPENYTSWRRGMLNVFELPLEQLVIKLEKRYNQRFEVDPLVKDFPYTFSIERESLSEVLHLIERISPVVAEQREGIIKLRYMKK